MSSKVCDVCNQIFTCKSNYLNNQKVVVLAELLVQDVRCHWNGVLQDHEHYIRYFVPVEFMPH